MTEVGELEQMGSSGDFSRLTLRHGLKCMPDDSISVEDVLVAVSEQVGGLNIKSASRMNKAVVIFLAEVQMVDNLIERGIVINNTFLPVLPLSSPSKKIVLSNVPPFIKNEVIQGVLERYGKLTAPIKMIPLGLKNPDIKHVMSFRRYTYMILNEQQDPLSLTVKLKNEGKDYTIFISSDQMRCFFCGEQGHVRQTCPNKQTDKPSHSRTIEQDVRQKNEHVPVVEAAPAKQADVTLNKDAENDDSAEVVENQAGVGEKSTPMVNKDDKRSEKEEMGMEDIEVDGETEAAVESYTQMSTMSSEYAHSENDSDNDLESLGSLSDGEDTERMESLIPKLYTVKQISDFLDETKGVRKPQIEAFFPDLKRFLVSCKIAMRKATFDELSRQKRYRLKKIITKVKGMTNREGKKV